MEYVCAECTKPFTPKQKPSRPDTPFCSLSCSARHQHRTGRVTKRVRATYKCFWCHKPFQGSPSNKEHPFCSQGCAATYNNKARANTLSIPPKRVWDKKGGLACKFCLRPSHGVYCSIKCQHRFERKQKIDRWLETGETGCTWKQPRWLKDYIQKEQRDLCSICSLPCKWNNQPLTFVLDHINRDTSNHARVNLRLICPNCDSQLPTFKSRNRHSAREYRRQRYAEGKTY